MENCTKHGMHRRVRSAPILIAIFFVVGELGAVRGDNVLEADGPGQNLTSIDKIYSTSTAQPAMLAIQWRDYLIDPRSDRDSAPGWFNRATGAGDWKPDHRRKPQHTSIGTRADRNIGCDRH